MRSSRKQAKVRLSWHIPALLVALAVALASGPARAAEPFENLMPDGCFVCVTIRSVPDIIGPVKASPQFRLFSEPAMKPLLDEMAGRLEEMRAGMSEVLGVAPEDALAMLGGQVCVGILPRGDRDNHFLLLADVTGNPELAGTVVQHFLQYERDQGTYNIVEEDFRGHTVYHIQPIVEEKVEGAAGDDAAQGGGDEMPWNQQPAKRVENPGFVTISDGVLAFASSPDRTLLERFLVLQGGETLPNVGASDRYRRVQPFLGDAPDAAVFVDIRKAVEAAAKGADEALEASAPLALGLGLHLAPDGMAMQGLLLAPQPRSGIMRAFTPQGGTVMPPPCADADGAMIAGAHFSVPVLWEEITAALQRDDPETFMTLQQSLANAPVDVENNVIKALGHRCFVYVPGPSGSEDESMGTPIALMADLVDADAFRTAWKQLLMSVPPMLQVETIDFMGVEIQQFSFAMQTPNANVRLPQPCFAVMADKLLFASGLDVAKGIIKNDARQASPLLDQQGFRQLLGRTMDNPDALVYVNGQAMGKLMKAQAERQAQMMKEMGMEQGEDNADQMPWDVVEKYSSDSILTARWTDEGLEIKAWSPGPAQAE
jgi:hypothetical protein